MTESIVAPLIPPDPTNPRFAADPEAVYGPIRARACLVVGGRAGMARDGTRPLCRSRAPR